MGKRKYQSKSSLPKGLPFKKARLNSKDAINANINPFENARASSSKSPKFLVHNRPLTGRQQQQSGNKLNAGGTGSSGPSSALKRAIDNRRNGLKNVLDKSKKVGSFIDRRIGESKKSQMTQEERILARIVRERSRRSKKMDKYTLDDKDDDNAGGDNGLSLTHRGKVIDENYTGKIDASDIILSDDDDDRYGGQLEKADTELHFGGGAFDRARRREAKANPYGPSSGGQMDESIGDRYRSRKEELDDLIMRKKFEKAQKAMHKEEQHVKFEDMDSQFKELAALLNFRDKEKEKQNQIEAKKAGTLSTEDQEMDDWEKEMKGYLFERKVKATDRTKTPEEIAKEEAERLHELETKRLARMNGDFDNDDLSDISDDEEGKKRKKKKVKSKDSNKTHHNPDELDSEDEEESDELESRFTADGLMYFDKFGNAVRKVGEGDSDGGSIHGDGPEEEDGDDDSDEDDCESLGASDDDASVESDDGLSSGEEEELDPLGEALSVGTKIKGKYRADEQFEGKGKWYKGKITKVSSDEAGNTIYDVEYDDGDVEEKMKPENIRRQKSSQDEKQQQDEKRKMIAKMQEKRQKAKDKARTEIPYVFEVPTTLEALNDMIANYAATGEDASLIIQRIHKANSVRLDKRNKEKMQNFCDVLLRRFMGIGEGFYKGGNGGSELGRLSQLDSLTQVLYLMAQDAPDSAGAVWGRRLGIFQNAHAKRIRDSELVPMDDDEYSAWPSSGTLLLLRAVGHIFPVTDKRHVVITPALILMGQIIGQSPIRSKEDIVRGIFCAGLMIEFTKEAKRIPIEAIAFLASVINLYSSDKNDAIKAPIPTFNNAVKFHDIQNLRSEMIESFDKEEEYNLSLEREDINSTSTSVSIIIATLRLVSRSVQFFSTTNSLNGSQVEVFEQITKAILRLNPSNKVSKFPAPIINQVQKTANTIKSIIEQNEFRSPLSRRSKAKAHELAIQTLAPRMEEPTHYSMSKDKNKTKAQAESDKLRREYRREHKAVSRELRLDAAFIESERRKEKDVADRKAREARNKNFAWLEQEQATMNQQVAQGGGLLKGGGIGAARSKAATGKLGIKKGGKIR